MPRHLPSFVRVAAVVLAMVLSAVPGIASQKRVQKWWQSEEVRTELKLTTQQSAAAEEIFQEAMPRLKAAKQELDRHEAQLSRLIADGTATEDHVTRQIDIVEAARSECTKLRTLMLFRVYRVLSSEQRIKLKALHRRWESDGSHSKDR